MLQAQQLAIAWLQCHPKTPNTAAPEAAPPTEQVPEGSSNNGSVAGLAIAKMLGDLSERIESGSWKFVQRPFPEKAAPEPISKKYRTP